MNKLNELFGILENHLEVMKKILKDLGYNVVREVEEDEYTYWYYEPGIGTADEYDTIYDELRVFSEFVDIDDAKRKIKLKTL